MQTSAKIPHKGRGGGNRHPGFPPVNPVASSRRIRSNTSQEKRRKAPSASWLFQPSRLATSSRLHRMPTLFQPLPYSFPQYLFRYVQIFAAPSVGL